MSAPRRVPETTAVISLGSNLGAREERVLAAASMLAATPGLALRSLSSLYETEPVEFASDRAFVNAACVLSCRLGPRDLLAACRRVEERAGRDRSGPSRDRTLDADIVLYGGRVVAEPDLAIPHPRLASRLFVLAPVAEIAPGLRVPPAGATIAELERRAPRDAWIRRVSGRGTIR